MRAMRTGLLAVVLATAGVAMGAREAQACGGCFAPPGAAQVVTDHRMVLALSSTQTTLWDQFQYSGDPEEFSWILPIRYTDTTRVELASDDFLTLVSNVGVAALLQPTPPPFPSDCLPPPFAGGATDAAVDASAAFDSGVTVLRQEVVGPYAVSILRGSSATGLRTWLTMNGYTIPTALDPVIDHYLGLSMDFVALRLRAGKGLNRMSPVRVTVDGYQPRLPLRMIAAGVADRVGLSLTVFANARIEAGNFPNLTFTDDDFTYDWNSPPDFSRLFVSTFDARNRAMGGRLWLTESSTDQNATNLMFLAQRLPRRSPFEADGGMATATPESDVALAFMGLGANARMTRLRADLPASALDRDLDLAASDGGTRDRFYRFGRELNRPAMSMCPWSSDGGTVDVAVSSDLGAPTSDAAIRDGGAGDASTAPTPAESSGGASCSAHVGHAGDDRGALWVAGLALASLVRVARRRRAR